MSLVVLSTRKQWEVWSTRPNTAGETVVCDNPRLRAFLDEKGVKYEFLDEFLFSEEERRCINAWGCGKAAEWVRRCRDGCFFGEMDLASHFFLRLGYILVQMEKNAAYARRLLEKHRPGAVTVFQTQNAPAYPKFSGNLFLNAYLGRFARENGIAVESVAVNFDGDEILSGLLSKRQRLMRASKSWIKQIRQRFGTASAPGPVDVLARGGLRHLGALLKELRTRGLKTALLDEMFQKAHEDFSRNHGLDYLLQASFDGASDAEFGRRAKESFERALKTAVDERWFESGGVNHGELLATAVYTGMEPYWNELAAWKGRLERLYARHPFSACLLDEDTTAFSSFLALFAASKGARVFTLSHATLPVDFSVNAQNRVFAVSETFVNSEYEREAYAARGWDPAAITPTGLPRFDHLKPRTAPVRGTRAQVLYCGASMKLWWPERGGYLGYHVTNNGDLQRQALSMMLSAMQGLPVELWVKPHNYEGQAWDNFLKDAKPSVPTSLVVYSDPIEQWLSRCDVMVLAHWSTAIIEAALMNVPVILWDPYRSADIAPYAQAAPFYAVRTEAEFRRALENILSPSYAAPAPGDPAIRHAFGVRDGRAAHRAADRIQAVLRASGLSPVPAGAAV